MRDQRTFASVPYDTKGKVTRRVVRVELCVDTVPDESTNLRFRHLLKQHQLTLSIVDAVRGLLADQRLSVKAGTMVDATIIAVPSSTKNSTKTHDPRMMQTRKENLWYFVIKVHVGTDMRGLIQTLTRTDAAAADLSQLDDLLHGQESTRYGDKAYRKADDTAQWEASGGRYRINRQGSRRHTGAG